MAPRYSFKSLLTCKYKEQANDLLLALLATSNFARTYGRQLPSLSFEPDAFTIPIQSVPLPV